MRKGDRKNGAGRRGGCTQPIPGKAPYRGGASPAIGVRGTPPAQLLPALSVAEGRAKRSSLLVGSGVLAPPQALAVLDLYLSGLRAFLGTHLTGRYSKVEPRPRDFLSWNYTSPLGG